VNTRDAQNCLTALQIEANRRFIFVALLISA